MSKIPRFPPRQKRADGTFGCRGCGADIPKGRLTWCSRECHLKFDPFYVKGIVRQRSGERCEMCGADCSRKAQQEHQNKKPPSPSYWDCGLPYPYDFKALNAHPLMIAHWAAHKAWRASTPCGEFDHIIPHSEGGKFTPNNIRFLCTPCHKARTRLWHKDRKRILKLENRLNFYDRNQNAN